MSWPLSAAATARLLSDLPVDRGRLLRLAVQELALVGTVALRSERSRWRRTTHLTWAGAPVPELPPLPLVAERLRRAAPAGGEVRRVAQAVLSADRDLPAKVELACTTALVDAGLARVDERSVLGRRRRRLVRTAAGDEAVEGFALLPMSEPSALLLRGSRRDRVEAGGDLGFDLGDDLGFGGADGSDGSDGD